MKYYKRVYNGNLVMQEQHIVVETQAELEERKRRAKQAKLLYELPKDLGNMLLFLLRNLKWIAPIFFLASVLGLIFLRDKNPLSTLLFGIFVFGPITFFSWRKTLWKKK